MTHTCGVSFFTVRTVIHGMHAPLIPLLNVSTAEITDDKMSVM